MSIAAVYIIDHQGKIIINRSYRGDIPSNAADMYFT